MKAVILAAGRGSRLGTLTDKRPKCMVELAGRPLLSWQRAALASAGVGQLAIVAGYRAQSLKSQHWKIFLAPEWQRTNMVCSLRAAAPWLRTQRCLVTYGDIVYSAAAVRALMAAPGDIAITYDPHWHELWALRFPDPLQDAENFQLAGDGTVSRIGGQARSAAEVEGQYMGLLSFTPAGWGHAETAVDALPASRQADLDMTSLLQLLIDVGHRIHAVPVPDAWAEVDTESDLLLYESLVAQGRLVYPAKEGDFW